MIADLPHVVAPAGKGFEDCGTGMIKAPSRGAPCRLEDFDSASLLARGHDSAP